MNLDTERRRLDLIQNAIDAALGDDQDGPPLEPATGEHLDYAELTAANLALRAQQGWSELDLLAALTEQERREWDLWRESSRMPWSLSDVAVVGLCGLVGSAACIVDQLPRGGGETDAD